MNFLLASWVFWGAAVWNFRYFRMSAASDLYCMLMAESGCGKGNLSDYPFANRFCGSVPWSWTCCGERLYWLGLLTLPTVRRARGDFPESLVAAYSFGPTGKLHSKRGGRGGRCKRENKAREDRRSCRLYAARKTNG